MTEFTARDGGRVVGRWIAGAALVGLFLSSARFVTAYPTRISVVPNLQVDASAYDAIAWSLSNTWSIAAIPPLQPPGFVVFLAAVFSTFGHSWIAGRLALWACLVVATGLSALVARRMYQSESSAWIAALLCASSPALTAYAGTLQYELLAAVLVIGLVWVAVRVANSPTSTSITRVAHAAAIGVGMGFAILTREVLVVLAPLVSVYVVRAASSERKRTAALIGAICLGFAALPPLVWSAVQSARAGRVVTISEKGPLVMAFGNNPAANGTFNAPLVGVPEPSGWAFIEANPRDAAWLWMRKAGYFWGVLRDGWNVPHPSGVFVANATAGTIPLQWILPWVRGGWLLLAVLIALASWRRDTWTVWWLIPAAVAAVMAVHVVTISSYRFAVPVLPLVMAVIAGPLAGAFMLVWRSRSATIIATVTVLLAAGAQNVSWPLVYDLEATEFDGLSGENQFDSLTGENVRFADASRGKRPVLILADEYLESGNFTIHMSVRTDGLNPDLRRPLFRVALSTSDGTTVCDHIVSGTQVSQQETTIELPCLLEDAGPSTLLVETFGTANLAFGSVRFAWTARVG